MVLQWDLAQAPLGSVPPLGLAGFESRAAILPVGLLQEIQKVWSDLKQTFLHAMELPPESAGWRPGQRGLGSAEDLCSDGGNMKYVT